MGGREKNLFRSRGGPNSPVAERGVKIFVALMVKLKIASTAINGRHPLRGKQGLADQGYGCLFGACAGGRERLALRAHTRRMASARAKGRLAWPHTKGELGTSRLDGERGKKIPLSSAKRRYKRRPSQRFVASTQAHHHRVIKEKAGYAHILKDILHRSGRDLSVHPWIHL